MTKNLPASTPIRLPSHDAWHDTLSQVSGPVKALVAATVDTTAKTLAEAFYERMLADERAAHMLDHTLVNQRLHASMTRWVTQLFDASMVVQDVVAVQLRTGEVHARIGVPMDMVTLGAGVLKRHITQHLVASAVPRDALAQAIPYVHELIDLAIGVMNTAYASNANRMARSDEAYRLFFLSQNMKAERERRKSQLLEWAQQILVRYYWEMPAEAAAGEAPDAASLSHSQFGLWLQHKAGMLFEDAAEIVQIQAHIQAIEGTLLPQLAQVRSNHVDARAVVSVINGRIESIKALLGSMFDRYTEVEDGRDGVTNLLNRRYLPSVAQREIALAQRGGGTFAMLLVDIDNFGALRSSLGIEHADHLLQQVAGALADMVRAGDFVFRVGEDQFLVLAVEAGPAAVMPMARGLRERIAATALRTASHATTAVTVSIGVALFDGHPDYQRMVDRASRALRQAKAQGRNQCVLCADEGP